VKQWLMDYVLDTYGIEPERPFRTAPDTLVFRNTGNRKWFAVLLGQLPKTCIGLADEGLADVLNLKCDPLMTHSLIDNQTIFHAYHMNKEHWISVLLDSPISTDELTFLVDLSYRLVERKSSLKSHEKSQSTQRPAGV